MSPGGALIAGIGRPRFGDDALGLMAAAALAEHLAGTARVISDDSAGWGALHALNGEDLLVVVDAAQASLWLPAGHWCRLRYPHCAGVLGDCGLRGTHSAGVDAVLAMAAALGQLPRETWIYALAGERFEPESAPSPAVSCALGPFVEEIRVWVTNWAAQGGPRWLSSRPAARTCRSTTNWPPE